METNIAILTPSQLRSMVDEGVEAALRKVLPEAIRQGTRKPYLTKREVMELTGWSARQIEYKKSRREIPCVRRGRLALFPTDEVYAWLEEGRVPAREQGESAK